MPVHLSPAAISQVGCIIYRAILIRSYYALHLTDRKAVIISIAEVRPSHFVEEMAEEGAFSLCGLHISPPERKISSNICGDTELVMISKGHCLLNLVILYRVK